MRIENPATLVIIAIQSHRQQFLVLTLMSEKVFKSEVIKFERKKGKS
jgi:hypothetical protein